LGGCRYIQKKHSGVGVQEKGGIHPERTSARAQQNLHFREVDRDIVDG